MIFYQNHKHVFLLTLAHTKNIRELSSLTFLLKTPLESLVCGHLLHRLHGTRRNIKDNEADFLKSHDKYDTFIETKYLCIRKFLLNYTLSKLNVTSDLWKIGNSL